MDFRQNENYSAANCKPFFIVYGVLLPHITVFFGFQGVSGVDSALWMVQEVNISLAAFTSLMSVLVASRLSKDSRFGVGVGRFESEPQAKRLGDFHHVCEARIAFT